MEPQELTERRRAVRPLLSPHEPADALASYYALWHDPHRTELHLHYDGQGRVDGFVAVCQTGADLFRPLVTLRAPDNAAVAELIGATLIPGRPYRVVVPERLETAVRTTLETSGLALSRVLVLDPARFPPIVNVLVQRSQGPDGAPRFQIEAPAQGAARQREILAVAGTNWRSPSFAEVFVYVHPRVRNRGYGRSVVSAVTAALLEERIRPLYVAEMEDEASRRLAIGMGYVDTGAREFACDAQLRAAPDATGLKAVRVFPPR